MKNSELRSALLWCKKDVKVQGLIMTQLMILYLLSNISMFSCPSVLNSWTFWSQYYFFPTATVWGVRISPILFTFLSIMGASTTGRVPGKNLVFTSAKEGNSKCSDKIHHSLCSGRMSYNIILLLPWQMI